MTRFGFLGQSINKEPRKNANLTDVTKRFSNNTSLHGVLNVTGATGLVKKVGWAFIVLGVTAGVLLHLVSVSRQYFSYSVSVSIILRHEEELPFPAVTICNMSPVKNSLWRAKFGKSEDTNQGNSSKANNTDAGGLSEAVLNGTQNTILTQDFSTNETCDHCCCYETNFQLDLNQAIQQINDTISRASPDEAPKASNSFPEKSILRRDFYKSEQVIEQLAGLDERTKWELGYELQDIILDCQYEGSTCSYNDFVHTHNPLHGNCYTFNSGWNRTIQMASRTGKRHGLHLTLNIDQDEYYPGLGDDAGIRAVIHHGNRMPFPDNEGILVAPGKLTNVGFQQSGVSRLSAPYGDCMNYNEKEDADLVADAEAKNVYSEYHPVDYSSEACLRTCQQRHTINRCGCADPYFPLKGYALSGGSTIVCSVTNTTQDDCRYEVQLLYASGELQCDCPNPCSSIEYLVHLSRSQWPSTIAKLRELQKLSHRPAVVNLTSDSGDPQKFRRNLLKLVVSYEELNYQSMIEHIAYPFSTFISDIGGVLGLWFGCSLFTVAEFLELLSDLSFLAYSKRKLRGWMAKPNDSPESQNTTITVNKKPAVRLDSVGDRTRFTWTRPNPARRVMHPRTQKSAPKLIAVETVAQRQKASTSSARPINVQTICVQPLANEDIRKLKCDSLLVENERIADEKFPSQSNATAVAATELGVINEPTEFLLDDLEVDKDDEAGGDEDEKEPTSRHKSHKKKKKKKHKKKKKKEKKLDRD